MLKTECRAEKMFFKNSIDIAIFQRNPKGKNAMARPLVFDVVEQGVVIEPAFSLHMDEAQLLMDELWRCGLRPTEGAGSAGSLAATERHLKDMQAIAMAALRKDGIQL